MSDEDAGTQRYRSRSVISVSLIGKKSRDSVRSRKWQRKSRHRAEERNTASLLPAPSSFASRSSPLVSFLTWKKIGQAFFELISLYSVSMLLIAWLRVSSLLVIPVTGSRYCWILVCENARGTRMYARRHEEAGPCAC